MSVAIQNRNQSFFLNIEKLSLRRKTTYNLIKTYGLITSHQLKELMRLGINQVSGRITELKDMFLIVEDGSVLNRSTNTMNTLYRVTSEDERINLANAKYQELVDQKKKLESDYQLGLSDFGLKTVKSMINKIDKKIDQLSKFDE